MIYNSICTKPSGREHRYMPISYYPEAKLAPNDDGFAIGDMQACKFIGRRSSSLC
jgi:hypothetical protein